MSDSVSRFRSLHAHTHTRTRALSRAISVSVYVCVQWIFSSLPSAARRCSAILNHSPCREMVDGCLFMLFKSRKDMCRRTLPILDLSKLPVGGGGSSETIFWVRTRDRGRVFGVMAPALKLRSVKKVSRSDVNLSSAWSKSKSSENMAEVRNGEEVSLTVTLLRLLLDPFRRSESLRERVDRRWLELRRVLEPT